MDKHPRYNDLLVKLKQLLPNSDENPNYEFVTDYALTKTINDVSNYCHVSVEKLPEELDMTIIGMVVQVINTHQWLVPADQQSGNVSSLSEGDASVSFRSPAEVYQQLQSLNTVTDNYVSILNSFRRIQR